MTKQELITELALCSDLDTKAAAERVLSLLKDIITRELQAGNEVALGQDFGTFKPVTKAARSGVVNNKPYSKPESKSVKFSPSAPLKRVLN